MVELPIDQASHERTRVLILTADAGFGHRSAANAVADALKEQYADFQDAFVEFDALMITHLSSSWNAVH